MAFTKTLKEQEITIYCDYCFRKITAQTYFRCEDCRFDYCAFCASAGIETDIHRNTHRYRIVSNLNQNIENSGWKLIDELLLLDGILTFGFDNFDDISKVLKFKKSNEIKKHLYKIIGIEDTFEAHNDRPTIKSNPNDSCVASFMSKRNEFDSEIINEYEQLIENLVFEEDDTEIETDLKRFLMENYKVVLRRRKIWREFILARKMAHISNLKAKETAELGEAINKKKWLAQYLSKNDFNVFISGIALENRLKSQISKHPGMINIRENDLNNNSKMLLSKESEICSTLNIPIQTYLKLKRLALEQFGFKQPLSKVFFELFSPEDLPRAKVIFNWFKKQNIIIEE